MNAAPRSRFLRRAAAGLLVLLAAGCSGPAEELSGWLEQQQREVKPNVQPLAPPKKFNPEPYHGAQSVDPFGQQKLSAALRQEARQPSSLLSGEMRRRREPLEAYPLDTMSMVGSVDRTGRRSALLRVEGLLYQVKVGDYIGQNYGRVVKIDETQIVLREIVQDAAGEWIERPASLQLQEQAR